MRNNNHHSSSSTGDNNIEISISRSVNNKDNKNESNADEPSSVSTTPSSITTTTATGAPIPPPKPPTRPSRPAPRRPSIIVVATVALDDDENKLPTLDVNSASNHSPNSQKDTSSSLLPPTQATIKQIPAVSLQPYSISTDKYWLTERSIISQLVAIITSIFHFALSVSLENCRENPELEPCQKEAGLWINSTFEVLTIAIEELYGWEEASVSFVRLIIYAYTSFLSSKINQLYNVEATTVIVSMCVIELGQFIEQFVLFRPTGSNTYLNRRRQRLNPSTSQQQGSSRPGFLAGVTGGGNKNTTNTDCLSLTAIREIYELMNETTFQQGALIYRTRLAELQSGVSGRETDGIQLPVVVPDHAESIFTMLYRDLQNSNANTTIPPPSTQITFGLHFDSNGCTDIFIVERYTYLLGCLGFDSPDKIERPTPQQYMPANYPHNKNLFAPPQPSSNTTSSTAPGGAGGDLRSSMTSLNTSLNLGISAPLIVGQNPATSSVWVAPPPSRGQRGVGGGGSSSSTAAAAATTTSQNRSTAITNLEIVTPGVRRGSVPLVNNASETSATSIAALTTTGTVKDGENGSVPNLKFKPATNVLHQYQLQGLQGIGDDSSGGGGGGGGGSSGGGGGGLQRTSSLVHQVAQNPSAQHISKQNFQHLDTQLRTQTKRNFCTVLTTNFKFFRALADLLVKVFTMPILPSTTLQFPYHNLYNDFIFKQVLPPNSDLMISNRLLDQMSTYQNYVKDDIISPQLQHYYGNNGQYITENLTFTDPKAFVPAQYQMQSAYGPGPRGLDFGNLSQQQGYVLIPPASPSNASPPSQQLSMFQQHRGGSTLSTHSSQQQYQLQQQQQQPIKLSSHSPRTQQTTFINPQNQPAHFPQNSPTNYRPQGGNTFNPLPPPPPLPGYQPPTLQPSPHQQLGQLGYTATTSQSPAIGPNTIDAALRRGSSVNLYNDPNNPPSQAFQQFQLYQQQQQQQQLQQQQQYQGSASLQGSPPLQSSSLINPPPRLQHQQPSVSSGLAPPPPPPPPPPVATSSSVNFFQQPQQQPYQPLNSQYSSTQQQQQPLVDERTFAQTLSYPNIGLAVAGTPLVELPGADFQFNYINSHKRDTIFEHQVMFTPTSFNQQSEGQQQQQPSIPNGAMFCNGGPINAGFSNILGLSHAMFASHNHPRVQTNEYRPYVGIFNAAASDRAAFKTIAPQLPSLMIEQLKLMMIKRRQAFVQRNAAVSTEIQLISDLKWRFALPQAHMRDLQHHAALLSQVPGHQQPSGNQILHFPAWAPLITPAHHIPVMVNSSSHLMTHGLWAPVSVPSAIPVVPNTTHGGDISDYLDHNTSEQLRCEINFTAQKVMMPIMSTLDQPHIDKYLSPALSTGLKVIKDNVDKYIELEGTKLFEKYQKRENDIHEDLIRKEQQFTQEENDLNIQRIQLQLETEKINANLERIKAESDDLIAREQALQQKQLELTLKKDSIITEENDLETKRNALIKVKEDAESAKQDATTAQADAKVLLDNARVAKNEATIAIETARQEAINAKREADTARAETVKAEQAKLAAQVQQNNGHILVQPIPLQKTASSHAITTITTTTETVIPSNPADKTTVTATTTTTTTPTRSDSDDNSQFPMKQQQENSQQLCSATVIEPTDITTFPVVIGQQVLFPVIGTNTQSPPPQQQQQQSPPIPPVPETTPIAGPTPAPSFITPMIIKQLPAAHANSANFHVPAHFMVDETMSETLTASVTVYSDDRSDKDKVLASTMYTQEALYQYQHSQDDSIKRIPTSSSGSLQPNPLIISTPQLHGYRLDSSLQKSNPLITPLPEHSALGDFYHDGDVLPEPLSPRGTNTTNDTSDTADTDIHQYPFHPTLNTNTSSANNTPLASPSNAAHPPLFDITGSECNYNNLCNSPSNLCSSPSNLTSGSRPGVPTRPKKPQFGGSTTGDDSGPLTPRSQTTTSLPPPIPPPLADNQNSTSSSANLNNSAFAAPNGATLPSVPPVPVTQSFSSLSHGPPPRQPTHQ